MSGFSLIIPAYNEVELLPSLLVSVTAAVSQYRGKRTIQVIVADNGSTDGTAQLALRHGAQVVHVEKRAIAAARNGGAAAADGQILCFVDADSIVHPQTFNVIERSMTNPRVVGGATGAVFERWSPGIFCTYACFLPFVWFANIDTGVVFFKTNAFHSVGGYPEDRLYAEDVGLLFNVKRYAKQHNLVMRRPRGAKTITSARKFDQFGDWHYFGHGARILWRLLRRRETDTVVKRYWYERVPRKPP